MPKNTYSVLTANSRTGAYTTWFVEQCQQCEIKSTYRLVLYRNRSIVTSNLK